MVACSLVGIVLSYFLYYDDIKNRGGCLDKVYKDDVSTNSTEKDSGSSSVSSGSSDEDGLMPLEVPTKKER